MNLHKHQLYLLEQHSESFNTEGKYLIVNLGPKSFTLQNHDG